MFRPAASSCPSSARRSAAAGAVLAALLPAACASPPADTGTRAVYLGPGFPTFPAELPGETRSFPAPDATLAVVHVRQTHLPPDLGVTSVEHPLDRAAMSDRNRTANDTQREIVGILRTLAGAGFRRVYAEGAAVVRGTPHPLAAACEYMCALKRIDAVVTRDPPTLPERFATYGTSALSDDELWESFRYAPGADLLLALSGEIDLVAGESGELLWRAGEALRTDGVAAAEAFSDAREDAILETVATSGGSAAVVLLGASHDLSDNVERWNVAHPARRISLVVVTPP